MSDPTFPTGFTAEDLLTRSQASAELAAFGIRMKPETLARAWCRGSGGPPCRHIRGKPYYPRALLHGWARNQITPLAASARDRDLQRRDARRRGGAGEARHV